MNSQRPIPFRERAWRHYAQHQEKDVVFHRINPRRLFWLWCLTGLCLVGIGGTLSISLPQSLSGIGTFRQDQMQQTDMLLVFLPSITHSSLQVGQILTIQAENTSWSVLFEEGNVVADSAIFSRFGIQPQPSMLALAFASPVSNVQITPIDETFQIHVQMPPIPLFRWLVGA